MNITRDMARDMAEAHAEGMHHELPRDGCPECEDRSLTDYPDDIGARIAAFVRKPEWIREMRSTGRKR